MINRERLLKVGSIMSDNTFLRAWWQQTDEFNKISEKLKKPQIFLLFGPPGIGKQSLIEQIISQQPSEFNNELCYKDLQYLDESNQNTSRLELIESTNQKHTRIIVRATIYDFFELYGITKTSKSEDLKSIATEVSDRIGNLVKKISTPKKNAPFFYPLLISHEDAKKLLLTIIKQKGKYASPLNEEEIDLILEYARISSDDVKILQIESRKGYYFPSLIKEGFQKISDDTGNTVDASKFNKFKIEVKKGTDAEKVLLPTPQLFPTVNPAIIPLFLDLVNSQESDLAGKITQNFTSFLEKNSDLFQDIFGKLLINIGLPGAGIGLALLAYFGKNENDDLKKTLNILPNSWRDLPPVKREAIGECYDGLLGLEKGTTKKSFDDIALKSDEFKQRITSLEANINQLDGYLKNELKEIRETTEKTLQETADTHVDVKKNLKKTCEIHKDVKTLLDFFIRCTGNTLFENDRNGERKWYETRAINYEEDITKFNKDFVGREWLFAWLNTWEAHKNSRLLLLTGEAGIGKSAISAQLATRVDVKGLHFCSQSNPDSCKPEAMISVLISQLAHQFPIFKEILDQTPVSNTQLSPDAFFRTYVTDPLLACEKRLCVDGLWIIVIDGLDEATDKKSENAMVDFLIESVDRFPSWFRVITTARPSRELVHRFRGSGIKHTSLDTESVDNRADVSEYIRKRVESEGLKDILGIITKIDDLAAGNFLYAKIVINALTEVEPDYRLTPDDLGMLPPALGGLYDRMFRKRFPDIDLYTKEVAPLAACLAVTKIPVAKDPLIAASGLDPHVAARGIRTLSQFLTQNDDRMRLFHQSLIQWLKEEQDENPYAIFPKEGCSRLAEAGLKEVRAKNGEISEYTLFTLPFYLVEAEMFDELVEILQNSRYINGICKKDREGWLAIWAFVEKSTSLRKKTLYKPMLESPSQIDASVLENIAYVLRQTGHFNEAMILYKEQERICREGGLSNELQKNLENQTYILFSRGDHDVVMDMSREMERICRDLGLNDGLQSSLLLQGCICGTRGDIEKSMILLKEQEQICRDHGLKDGLQKSLRNQGVMIEIFGDPYTAMTYYKECERICRDLGLNNGLQNVLGKLGNTSSQLGNNEYAIECFKEREQICRDLDLMEGLQDTLADMGFLHLRLNNNDTALTLFQQQEKICRDLGLKSDLATCLKGQGLILKALGNLDGAFTLFKEVEQKYKNLDSKKAVAESLTLQIGILRMKKDYVQALTLCKKVEDIYRQIDLKKGLADCLGDQGILYDDQHDYKKAMELYSEAEKIYEEFDFKDRLEEFLGFHGCILHNNGDLDSAMLLYKKEEQICRELDHFDNLQIVLGNQSLILERKHDYNGAMALLKERESICREHKLEDSLQECLNSQGRIEYKIKKLGDTSQLEKERKKQH